MGLTLDFDDLTYSAQWYEFETGEMVMDPADDDERVLLKIRPQLTSKTDVVVKEKGIVLRGKEQCRVFKHCLMDWRNVTGADGQALECDNKVKQKVFDYRMGGIPVFVMNKLRQFDAEKEEEEKNS